MYSPVGGWPINAAAELRAVKDHSISDVALSPFMKGAMKVIASIEEIRTEMQRRIDASKWADGYCAGCQAPIPWRIPHDGIANWTADVAPTEKRGCEGFVLGVVAAVRRDYDLPARPLMEAIVRPHIDREGPF
jgi:hypothetical protein